MSDFIKTVQSRFNNFNCKIGLYAENLKSGKMIIGINHQKNFAIASIFKINILMSYAFRIFRNEVSLEEEIPILSHNRVPGSTLATSGEQSKFSINELLLKMIQKSDNTATDTLGDYIGWHQVLEECSNWQISNLDWIMPTRLQLLLGADLWPFFKGKNIQDKINIWNEFTNIQKMEVIDETIHETRDISVDTISASFQSYYNSLSFLEMKQLAHAFSWCGSPQEYARLMLAILTSSEEKRSPYTIAKEYLIASNNVVVSKAFPNSVLVGRKGGSDEGVRCITCFLQSGGKATGTGLSIFVEEYSETDFDNIMESIEEKMDQVVLDILEYISINS
ncbi:serine hydrolase [bacterium]|nr:serine hydrolase [bacterium]